MVWCAFCGKLVCHQLFSAMRFVYLILVLFTGIFFAGNVAIQADDQDKLGIEIASQDSVEYELVVFDSRFESFLASQPYQKEFYSNEYYRDWNIRYCIEWNIRHKDPFRYGTFYETEIPYNASVNYGLDFNYRLYQYFQFIEKEYGIILLRRKGK